MSAPRQVTVAVVSWNGRPYLETCLPALYAQVDPGVPYEILVLDNGSSDDTAAWIHRHHPRVRLIRSEWNLGFCAGNNRLAAMAEGDAIAFLNNDTRPAPTWLARLVSALAEAPEDVAAISGLLTDWEGQRLDCARGVMTFDGHAFQLGYGQPLATAPIPRAGAEMLFPTGGNMLIRTAAFREAGGFDEDYFAYYEDVDLGWRLWSGGQRVLFAPEAIAAHRAGATGLRLGLDNRGLLFERNSFLTAYKNYERGLWEEMMPAILLTLLARSQTLLVGANHAGDVLSVDPYAGGIADTGPGRNPPEPAKAGSSGAGIVRRAWGRLRRQPDDAPRAPRITDARTVAQFRAIDFLLRHLDGAAAKRLAVQSRRRRSDREIFDRFPPYLVPTYPGDEALFAGAGFRSWLPRGVRLVESTLGDVMSRDP